MVDWGVVVLGLIEGVTEFLPISSTGHLLIAEHWLGSRSDTFNIVIQAGAMLAVTIVYWRRLVSLADWRRPESRLYCAKLAVAFVTTCVVGLIVKKLGVELPSTVAPVAWAMVIGGFWIIAAEWRASRLQDRSDVTWLVAVVVGLAQIVAGIFPGTSRSGATIFAAMLFGTSDRRAATEFAFLVGIPTMYAASAYEIYKNFGELGVNEPWTALGAGFVVSAVTAFCTIRWLLGYIQAHRYTVFAIYRILAGVALLGVSI
ncbi:undecaprenyl-diphosphatase [Aquamicrobium terrae]